MKIAVRPDKTNYVSGEKFAAEGMVVKLIFADGSEIIVIDFKTDKTVLNYGDETVVITCTYEGADYSAELDIIVKESGDDSDNSSDSSGEEKSGCLADALIGGGAGVVVIAAAVVIFFVLKKKKR